MKIIIALLLVLAACSTDAPPALDGAPYRCLVLYRCGDEPIVYREWLACALDQDDAEARSTDAGFEVMAEDCPGAGRWVRVSCGPDTPSDPCAP